MTAERDTLLRQRDTTTADQGVLTTERDSAIADRDAALEEREALAAEREALVAERDRLITERDEFVRTHDALQLQRDTLAHERDEIRQERDREIAKLRDEVTKAAAAAAPAPAETPKPDAIEHAMTELQEMTGRPSQKSHKKHTVIGHAITELLQDDVVTAPAQASKKKSAAAANDKKYAAVRQDQRQAFPNALGVQIDGEAALLVDLSVSGAQVLSCSALKPAKNVKMLLPSSDQPVLCRGRIVWARLEPTMPGKPIRYRAGMTFTGADQAAVQTFMSRHSSRPAK
jgi:methyl-accepting chemotaxis protein